MKYTKGVSCVKNWKLGLRVIPLCLFVYVFSQYLYRNILSQTENEIVSARNVNLRESLLLRQKTRKQFLTDVCKNLPQDVTKTQVSNNELASLNLDYIYVDDRYRLLYCEIPKVACTNWKRILLVLSGKLKMNPKDMDRNMVHDQYKTKYLRTLQQYSSKEIRHRLDNYYKFMFVREPMERLLSAYRDKFAFAYKKPNGISKVFGPLIVRRYRVNASKDSLEKGHDVTFQEFVNYLLDPVTVKFAPFDAHWRPYHQLCHPCFIHYDLIGKYETLSEDAGLALKQIGIEHLINFPSHDYGPSKTSRMLHDAYVNISAPEINQLWKLYSTDFSLFNYDYPRFD